MKNKHGWKAAALVLLSFIAFTQLTSCSGDDAENPDIDNPISDPDPEPDPDPDPDPDPGADVSDNSVVRINSGGPEIAYGEVIFLEDQFFSEENSEAFTNPDVLSISSTVRDEVFLTERNSIEFRGSFSYDIPISNGDYRVILHFAEIFWGQPGEGADGGANDRIFDVSIEGTTVVNNLDIFDTVGGATALTETYIVTVEDEELNIVFSSTTDKPKISAIEIEGDGSLMN